MALGIFQYDFMVRAFVVGVIIAIIAPIIGTFLVVRRYSLMADTLAHVSLLGVAVGLLSGINPLITSVITAAAAAFGIEKLRTAKKVYGESALALFLTGSLAIATVIIGIAHGFNANLFSFLFGSITTVAVADVYLVLGLGVIIIFIIAIIYPKLFAIALDEDLASVSGIPVKALNILLAVLAAITIALSLRIVGVLLIGALMVIPVITALQYNLSFKKTIGLSVLLSLFSVVTGLLLSYYFNLASGGTIVIVAMILFFASLPFNRHR